MTDTKALADRLESGRWRANDLPEAARILREVVPGMEDVLRNAPEPVKRAAGPGRYVHWSLYFAWFDGPRQAALDAMEKDDES